MAAVYITPDRKLTTLAQREDITSLVLRINDVLGLPLSGIREVGLVRTASDNILRYRVEEATFRAIVAASTGGRGLTASEIANATLVVPPGDATTTITIANIYHDVLNPMIVLGDSITAGTSSGATNCSELWHGQLFNAPIVGDPGSLTSGPSSGQPWTWYDRLYERQAMVYGFPSAQLYNVTPEVSFSGNPQVTSMVTIHEDNLGAIITDADLGGIANGQWVRFTSSGTLPAPLAANTDYYLGNVTTGSGIVRAAAADIDVATNTITRNAVGAAMWANTFNGHPISYILGANASGTPETPTAPGPLAENTMYYVGSITATTFKLYPTRADAIAQTNEIDLTSQGFCDGAGQTALHGFRLGYTFTFHTTLRDGADGTNIINITNNGSGTHSIFAPMPCWFRMLDRYCDDVRLAPNQIGTVVVYVGTNSVAYNGSQAVTGAGSIVEQQLIPFMTKLRTKFPSAGRWRVLFMTPIVRSNTTGLNNRLAQFRDYIIANQVSLGIDAVYDPSLYTVNGVNIFSLANPTVNNIIRAAAADINLTTNTITRNAAGDALWPSSFNGQPVRCYVGADTAGNGITPALPSPLVAGTTYYVGSITATTFKLYPTQQDALNQTNEIDLTSQGVCDGSAANALHGFMLAYIATDAVHPLVPGQIELGKALKPEVDKLFYRQ